MKTKATSLGIGELQRTLQTWNELTQKPAARTVQNFHKYLQVYMDKAGEHFMKDVPYHFSDHNSASNSCVIAGHFLACAFLQQPSVDDVLV